MLQDPYNELNGRFELHRRFCSFMRSMVEQIFLSEDDLNNIITGSLKQLGEFTGVDRVILSQFSEDGKIVAPSHEWCAEGMPSGMASLRALETSRIPWWMNTIREKGMVICNSENDVPDDAIVERALFYKMKNRSLISILVKDKEKGIGFVSLYSLASERTWNEDEINFTSAFGNMIVHALRQNKLIESLQQSQAELHRRVMERTWELKHANDLLVAENEQINRLQKELANSEFKYRSIVEHQTEYIIRFTPGFFIITFVNESICNIKGEKTENICGHSLLEILSEQNTRLFYQMIGEIAFDKNISILEFMPWPEESNVWHEWILKAVHDENGTIIEYQATGRDVTSRKAIENELVEAKTLLEKRVEERTSELQKINEDLKKENNQRREVENKLQRYNLAFMMSVDAFFITDAYGKILDINGTALEITGFNSLEEIVGHNIFELLSEHEGRRIFKIIKPVAEGKNVKNLELYINNVQRGPIPLEVSLSMLSADNSDEEGFIITARDITERKKSEEELRNSLSEKETLLKEIHHRVKNNLQIIHSILSLQSRYIQDPALLAILVESQDRIRAMSFVHECLYRSQNISRINMQDYINELIRYLYQSYVPDNASIMIYSDIIGLGMDLQDAIPCGLVFNELISNSLKHAFGDKYEGEIKVCFKDEGKNYKIRVSDNGNGLPKDVNTDHPSTFGLKLIKLLTEQLDGEMNIRSENGLTTVIKFPKQ
ncbi:MAG: PAS domain S-box protein [Bacteroidota bacterium]|nr:PAS domain S-box protein [Bacteroidota bacterium]